MKVLDTQILWQQGSCISIRRYLSGWHPEMGVLHWGWSGKETIQEKIIIKPLHVFLIED